MVSASGWGGPSQKPFLTASGELFRLVLSLRPQAARGLLAVVLYGVQEQRDGRCQKREEGEAQIASMQITVEYGGLTVLFPADVIRPGL